MKEPNSRTLTSADNVQWKSERNKFFGKVREIQERAKLTPEEAEQLAEEAVKFVRNSKYMGDK